MATNSLAVIGADKPDAGKTVITGTELGVTNQSVFYNFINQTTINYQPVSYRELKRMTDQDGMAKALLNIITMPLRAAKWDVYNKEEYDQVKKSGSTSGTGGSDSSDERDLIHTTLFTPPQEGGMSIPFDRVVARMSLAVRDGFKVFEKVFKINDRGFVVLKKLANRDNDTVYLRMDSHGDYDGFVQQTNSQGRYINVEIEKRKSLLYTFGEEENSLYGNPLFLPVYYHFDKKHKLYYISHVAYQMLAIPPRVATVPAGLSPEIKGEILKNVGSLGMNSTTTVPVGVVVEAFESKRSLADFLPLIDHHDNHMAQAVLGQFLNLTKASTGMLSSEQSDMFLLALKSIIGNMENVFNFYCIPDLVDLNFNSGNYPRLCARPFTDKDQQNLKDIFTEVFTAGTEKNSPQFLAAVEERMANVLNINGLDYEEIETQMVDASAKRLDAATQPPANQGGRPAGESKGTKQSKEGNS